MVWSLKQDPETGDILYWVHGPKIQNGANVSKNQYNTETEKKPVKRNTRKKKRYNPMKNETEPLELANQKSLNLELPEHETILRDYFQLDIGVADLYKEWCNADEHFKEVAERFPGIRILRQDPTENLFAFICSSNNHISR